MEVNNNKKIDKSTVVAIVIMAILLLGVIGIFVWDFIMKILRGWSGNDTISVSFFIMIAIVGIVTIVSFQNYFVGNNKEIIILNNEIYRTFTDMETSGAIKEFEASLIKEENNRSIKKMNSIAQKKNKDIEITLDSIDNHFYKNSLYKGEVGLFNISKLSSLYDKIKGNKSIKYEKLYKSVHNGELIKEHKFPLFQFVAPLMFGFIGLFVSLYQTIATDGSIQEPLIEYLKLFGFFVIFALSYTFLSYRSFKEGKISEKKKLLSKLKMANSKD